MAGAPLQRDNCNTTPATLHLPRMDTATLILRLAAAAVNLAIALVALGHSRRWWLRR